MQNLEKIKQLAIEIAEMQEDLETADPEDIAFLEKAIVAAKKEKSDLETLSKPSEKPAAKPRAKKAAPAVKVGRQKRSTPKGGMRKTTYKEPLPTEILETAKPVRIGCDFVVVTLTEAIHIETPQEGKPGDKVLTIAANGKPVAILEQNGTVSKSIRQKKQKQTEVRPDDEANDSDDDKKASQLQVANVMERIEEIKEEVKGRDTGRKVKEKVENSINALMETITPSADDDVVTKGEIKSTHKVLAKIEDIIAENANENEGREKHPKKRPNRRNCDIKGVTKATAPLLTFIEKEVLEYHDGDTTLQLNRIIVLKNNTVVAEYVNLLGIVWEWKKICLSGNDPVSTDEPSKDDIDHILFKKSELMQLYKGDGNTYKSCSDKVKSIYQKCVKDGTCTESERKDYERHAGGCGFWVRSRLLNAEYVTYLHSEAKKRYNGGTSPSKEERKAAKEKYGNKYYNAWEEVRKQWRKKYLVDHKISKNQAKFSRKKVYLED